MLGGKYRRAKESCRVSKIYMTSRTSFAPGKIILSGEYAVLFGYSGIGIPSHAGIEVVFEEDAACDGIEINWVTPPVWLSYAHKVVELCREKGGKVTGKLLFSPAPPFGKGKGFFPAFGVGVPPGPPGEKRGG